MGETKKSSMTIHEQKKLAQTIDLAPTIDIALTNIRRKVLPALGNDDDRVEVDKYDLYSLYRAAHQHAALGSPQNPEITPVPNETQDDLKRLIHLLREAVQTLDDHCDKINVNHQETARMEEAIGRIEKRFNLEEEEIDL